MKINLNWVNRSSNEEGTRLYRSLTPFDESTLPEPLAVLPKGADSYVDEDVVRNTLYYYRTEVFKGQDKLLSPQSAYMATSHYGPGPQKLLAGDFHVGYFGTVTSTEFFTPTEVTSLTGVSHDGLLTMNTWYKFAFRGKILFIPTKALARQRWSYLESAGVIYGEDIAHPLTGMSENQAAPKVITKKDDNFIVRLPSYLSPDATSIPTSRSSVPIVDIANSEWHELMGRITRSASLPWFAASYPQSTSISIVDNINSSLSSYIPVQDNTADYFFAAFRKNGTSTVYNRAFYHLIKSSTDYLAWFPVLEMKLH